MAQEETSNTEAFFKETWKRATEAVTATPEVLQVS